MPREVKPSWMTRAMRKVSLRTKVFAVIFAVTAAVVIFFTTYFPARHLDWVRLTMEKKGQTYARVLAREAEPAVAFDDRVTAREIFDAATQDPDVRALALLGAAGTPLHVAGEPSSLDHPASLDGLWTDSSGDRVRVAMPVVSKEGPRGVLLLELGTSAVDEERVRTLRMAFGAGFVALCAGFVSAWAFSRSLARRLRVIAGAAQAVAAGALDAKPLDDPSDDDVGRLARGFTKMSANLAQLVARISESAASEKERLDALVTKRTAQLDARNKDMRLVLDHVNQGFFTMDPSGAISGERSAITDAWLGTPAPGASIAAWIGATDARAGLWMQIGLEQMGMGIMPVELLLEQLPKKLKRGDTHLCIEYSPILKDGELARILVVISDVTDETKRRSGEDEQRELLRAFERLVADRAGFLEFMGEAEELVRVLDRSGVNDVELGRAIHTLKGNCGIYGLTSIAEACHALEDRIEDTGSAPSAEERADVVVRWRSFASKMRSITGEDAPVRIEASERDYEHLLHGIAEGTPRAQLCRELTGWRLEPTSRRLARLAEHAAAIAARLGKGGLQVAITHGDLRLPPERFAPFWAAFVHVLRNAIDHGIEPAEERIAVGKSEGGLIALRTYSSADDVVVELTDDGRGIDWDAVAERASARGVPHATSEERVEALFHDGVSTANEATLVSGRGIGLGAVRVACAMLGGRVDVVSAQGKGTTFRFRIPQERVAPRASRGSGSSPQAIDSAAL